MFVISSAVGSHLKCWCCCIPHDSLSTKQDVGSLYHLCEVATVIVISKASTIHALVIVDLYCLKAWAHFPGNSTLWAPLAGSLATMHYLMGYKIGNRPTQLNLMQNLVCVCLRLNSAAYDPTTK